MIRGRPSAWTSGCSISSRSSFRQVTDPTWQRHLKQIAPMNAGLAIQTTTDLRTLPIGPWSGLGVLAAWVAAALLAGGLLLHLRDA